jgi:hypothetical protein
MNEPEFLTPQLQFNQCWGAKKIDGQEFWDAGNLWL